MGKRRPGSEALAALAGLVLVSAVAVTLISPRFAADGPFVVDDWWGVKTASTAFDQLKGLGYNPAEFGDEARYRPAFTGIWNELQWHTLGAPQDMKGPNFWNVLRLLAFFSALTALTFTLLRGLTGDRRPSGVWLGVLANVPGMVLLATPTVVLAFARFGPQEPLMFAGLTLGALLILGAVRRWAAGGVNSVWQGVALASWLVAGYLLWLLGAYTKEASIVALGLAPFVYLYLDARWTREGVIDRSLWRLRAFQLAAVAMAIPLLHVALQALRRAGDGPLYNTAVKPVGMRQWADRVADVAHDGLVQMPALMQSNIWPYVLAAAPFLIAATMVWRRRADWLVAGLIAAAAALWVFQGLSGQWDARYYIPSITLTAVALLAGTPLSDRRWAPPVSIAAAALLVFSLAARHGEVDSYAQSLTSYDRAIAATAALHPGSCPVYMDGMPLEFAEAWPVLMSVQPGARGGPCDERFEAVAVSLRIDGAATNSGTPHVCAGEGWQSIRRAGPATISGCRRLLKGRQEKAPLSGQYAEDVLRWNRLVPGSTMLERLNDESAGPFCRAEICMAHFNALKGML